MVSDTHMKTAAKKDSVIVVRTSEIYRRKLKIYSVTAIRVEHQWFERISCMRYFEHIEGEFHDCFTDNLT